MLYVSPAFTKFLHFAHLGLFRRDKRNAKSLSDE